jgi:hypothetical protein
MPSTTAAQINAHQIAVTAAEGEKQRALLVAKQAYSGLGVDWAVYNASVKAADVAYIRALMTSFAANGFGTGPSHTLHELIGQDT